MNSVNEIGRLTKDPELKYTASTNTPVCSFDIAVDDGFGDKKKTYFFKCQAWSKTAENIVKFFGKGDLIGISGKLTTRSWEKDGNKHNITEIVVNEFSFCGGKKKDESAPINNNQPGEMFPIEEDDDLPF